MELQTGNFAPDFTLETDNIGEFSLIEQKGKKNIVLYFYPKDDTPGCTIEANDFTKLEKDFARNDTVILGVSKDDIKAHAKFREKHCLSFPLGYDETGSVCEAYGAWVEKSMYGKKYMGIERTTFLIDGNGHIRHIWNKVKVPNHIEDIISVINKK
jgi:peroxiredoxin Q/BCP